MSGSAARTAAARTADRAASARAASARAASAPTAPRVAGTRSRRLSVVPPLRTGAPRAPFVVLLGTLLTAGLAGLLFLHTALAEDSFRLQDLKNRSAVLAGREQALEQQVALAASPKRLAARAEALGMVRSENPVFIRLSDGKVLGKPKPGVAPPPPAPSAQPSAAANPTPAAPTPTAGAEVSPSSGPSGGPDR